MSSSNNGSIVEMEVVKRNGNKDVVSFDKILKRIKTMGNKKPKISGINYTALAMKVIEQLCNNITTSKIDELTAEQCHSMYSVHPDYNVLAGRTIVSKHHKDTSGLFSEVMTRLYNYVDKNGKTVHLVNDEVMNAVRRYGDLFDAWCDYERDYLLDYFGFKTLERAYLKAINKKVVERPQHMWLRVAIGIHCTGLLVDGMGDLETKFVLDKVKETYDYMSKKYFTHATPTLYNAGTMIPQLSSCYLLAMESDSLDGIFNTMKECALISKGGGGIGVHIHNIRATGSQIRGTDGYSNGIVPMLRVMNNIAKYVDQCVVPETLIYTRNGPKMIQDCVAGETEIFGRGGGCEVILDVLEHNYVGELLEIDTMHSIFPLKITPQHPVYALDMGGFTSVHEISDALASSVVSLGWIDAGELDENSMIAYPIPMFEKDYANLSCDDCYMYGVMIGNICMFSSDTCVNALVIKNNETVLEFVLKYFEKICVGYTRENIGANVVKIDWNHSVHIPFRYSDFFYSKKEKHIQGKWLNLPLEKCRLILKGLFDMAGYISDHVIVFESPSMVLIECCRFLCMKMGVLTTGFIRERMLNVGVGSNGYGNSIHDLELEYEKTACYSISVPKTKEIRDLMSMNYDSGNNNAFDFVRYENYLLTRVKNIRNTQYNGVLYDLQMKTEHNYVLHNGLVHNGGGKRKGSFAIYLEPWHPDIEDFLAMKRNQGNDELKARDLFYGLWVPDLFMKRVKEGGQWTLFCPDECPGLADCVGDAFCALYESYEKAGKGRKVLKAQDLWLQIIDSQMETGNPYLLYKDACNRKSNQQNLGVIKSSNLCTEIVQYSDSEESAVCNLASIALPAFVLTKKDGSVVGYDFAELRRVARVITYNLNRIIDINAYPSEKAHLSNMRHRPIGLGVQGLADVFMMMGLSFCSEEARKLNMQIFETLYLGAVEESVDLAEKFGAYSSFEGSPASRGLLQFDLWDMESVGGGGSSVCSGELMYAKEWSSVKEKLGRVGMRNSLLVAPMPTASTSQILGYNECFEPITSNFYMRKTLAGNFIVANKYLVRDLIEAGVWNERVKNSIISNNGSVQHLDLSAVVGGDLIKEKYRTVWEMKMKNLIDLSADRGRFICQSQSLNLWQEKATRASLTSMHFYAWGRGLKTGLYYLHTLAKAQTQQFSIEPTLENSGGGVGDAGSSVESGCEMCSA